MDTTLPNLVLTAPSLVRVALAAALWILALAFCLLSVAYLGVAATMTVRRLRRGHDLDRLLLGSTWCADADGRQAALPG